MRKRKKATTLFYIVDTILLVRMLIIFLWDNNLREHMKPLFIAFLACVFMTIAFRRITKEVEEENASLSNKVTELEEKIEKLEKKMDRFN